MTTWCTLSQAGTKSGQGVMVKLVKGICHCNIFTCTVHVNKLVKWVNLVEGICHCNIFTCTVHINKHVKQVNLDEVSAGPDPMPQMGRLQV